ncbi:hypothetical protein QYZ87_05695 [Porphyromonadaceae bacterium W3.11]|nr:hypothetical protein [Porphyromonadaceae bacterium W3.11]
MDSEKKDKREGLITIIPSGSLGKRIRVIASMIQVALRYHRPLEIIWFTSNSIPCASDRLFTLVPQLSQEGISIRQGTWKDYILNMPPSRDNLFVSLPFVLSRYDRIIGIKKFHSMLEGQQAELKDLLNRDRERILIRTSERINSYPNMYISLEATVEVNNVRRSRMSGWGQNVVGIHINRKDSGASFHESPTELFIKRMQKMIEEDDSVQFFIATTSKDEKERLSTIFRSRIFVPYSTTDIYSVKGAIQNMGELLALSYTRLILTTPGSSFSEVAAEIRQIPLETLSIFANTKVQK